MAPGYTLALYWFPTGAIRNYTAYIHSQIVHWTQILISGTMLLPGFENHHLSVLASEAIVRLEHLLRSCKALSSIPSNEEQTKTVIK